MLQLWDKENSRREVNPSATCPQEFYIYKQQKNCEELEGNAFSPRGDNDGDPWKVRKSHRVELSLASRRWLFHTA